jgi:hypothetical protein
MLPLYLLGEQIAIKRKSLGLTKPMLAKQGLRNPYWTVKGQSGFEQKNSAISKNIELLLNQCVQFGSPA